MFRRSSGDFPLTNQRTLLRKQVFVAIFIVEPTTDGLAWFCANIADHQVNPGRARRSSLVTGLASYAPAEILKGKP